MQHYFAIAYHPSLPDGRAKGHLRVEPGGLRFVAEEGAGAAWLPFDKLQQNLVGMNRDVPEFRHPASPEWVILCQDRKIANNEHFAEHKRLQGSLMKAERAHRSMGWPMKTLVASLILFLVGLVMLWSARHAITRSIVRHIPVSWEEKLGEVSWAQVKSQETLIDDAALHKELAAVTDQLLPAAKPSGHTFRFHIAKNDALMNAYALPGGNIVVYTGLMKKVKRPDQLAGVLAHEMAHVIQRHSLQNLVSNVGLYVVISGVVGDASALAAVLSEGSQALLGQQFSRDVETEADDVAWDLMMKAKLDPRGLREFFEILRIEEKAVMGSLMDGPLSWLSTHPTTDERISRLREKERALLK